MFVPCPCHVLPLPCGALPAGVVKREIVMGAADWFVDDFEALRNALPRYRAAMIGSGGWLGWVGAAVSAWREEIVSDIGLPAWVLTAAHELPV